jgi:hypothetical protein
MLNTSDDDGVVEAIDRSGRYYCDERKLFHFTLNSGWIDVIFRFPEYN